MATAEYDGGAGGSNLGVMTLSRSTMRDMVIECDAEYLSLACDPHVYNLLLLKSRVRREMCTSQYICQGLMPDSQFIAEQEKRSFTQ